VKIGVVIPAAGVGRRMGRRKKAFLELEGTPVLLRALRPFLEREDVARLVVVLSANDAAAPPEWLPLGDPRLEVTAGGSTRSASVRRGLRALPDEVELIAIHDGARPLVDPEVVERCVEVAAGGVGAVAGWPAVDTIKEVDGDEDVRRTPDRSRLWHAHTPQVFPRELLLRAYRGPGAGGEDGGTATDDAALVEEAGGGVRMVRGSRWNVKITRPEDLAVAAALVRREK